jgi:hypothetical protein
VASLTTQVGGKYSPDDDSVFQVKRHLVAAGIMVAYPMLDYIHSTVGDFHFAFDPMMQSFARVEERYYAAIRSSSFHTVANVFRGQAGYVGNSAALEICAAMAAERPIISLHPIKLQGHVDGEIAKILEHRAQAICVVNLLDLPVARVHDSVTSSLECADGYELSSTERRMVSRKVQKLLLELADVDRSP